MSTPAGNMEVIAVFTWVQYSRLPHPFPSPYYRRAAATFRSHYPSGTLRERVYPQGRRGVSVGRGEVKFVFYSTKNRYKSQKSNQVAIPITHLGGASQFIVKLGRKGMPIPQTCIGRKGIPIPQTCI